jgi:hypothetical protein
MNRGFPRMTSRKSTRTSLDGRVYAWQAAGRNGMALLSAGALPATGCSGHSSGAAAPGRYVIQISGTGTSSDVIHYQNIALTITQ